MKPKIFFAFVLLIAFLLMFTPALAITFGEPDGNGHPNVGALYFEEDGSKVLVCSGTLICPDVFLTAAHCIAWMPDWGINPDQVGVTFSPVFGDGPFYGGVYQINSSYGHDMGDLHDVAVILLDEPIIDIEPASLPPANLLDEMKANKELKDQYFVTVGYGGTRDDKTGGPHALNPGGVRYYALQTYNALTKSWLKLSMNPSTGDGGTCYGDSGGPHFLGDSDMVVSLTVTGDAWCRATDVTYRMDTASARDYLGQFVTLP